LAADRCQGASPQDHATTSLTDPTDRIKSKIKITTKSKIKITTKSRIKITIKRARRREALQGDKPVLSSCAR